MKKSLKIANKKCLTNTFILDTVQSNATGGNCRYKMRSPLNYTSQRHVADSPFTDENMVNKNNFVL